MTLSVSRLAPGEEAEWDDFVRTAPEGTFFHLSGWKPVIEQAFGHRTHYLIARNGRSVEGVLPLTEIKSPLFGHRLISNAFCVYGGTAAASEPARALLAEEAARIGRELNVECVEFHSEHATHPEWLTQSDLYVTFRLPLHETPEAVMNALPRKQRNKVRKGISNGLVSVCDDAVDRMHHIYAESVRNLGTPVFSKRYFRLLKAQFASDCDIVTVLHGDKPLASAMNFYFRDEAHIYYAGGTMDGRELVASDFMFWEIIRRSLERGFKVFDFGRSKVGTGAYAFKEKWGIKPMPLQYQYFLVKASEMPGINPLNPKYAAMIAVWKRLPLPLTKLIGPPIVRQIG